MRACCLQRSIGCNALYLHAPGRTLVDQGVDDYPRSGALEVAGPVSSPLLRNRVWRLTHEVAWSITTDAFATESNTLVLRFFARYAEPRAEAEDAFTVPDWA